MTDPQPTEASVSSTARALEGRQQLLGRWKRLRRRGGWAWLGLFLLGVVAVFFRDSKVVDRAWLGYLVLLASAAGALLFLHNQIQEQDALLRVEREEEREGASRPNDDDLHRRIRRSTLRRDRLRLQQRIRWQASLRTVLTIGILVDAACGALISFNHRFDYLRLVALLVVLVFSLQVTRERLRELEADLRQLEYESAVVDAGVVDKAETLFLKHQFELRRYYDQTLRHGALIFYLGVVLLALGAAVVVVGLVFISEGDKSTAQYIVTGGLAGIGGIMTNYVARMYFRMHAAAVDSMSTFHHRLVRDHDLHFANMLLAPTDEANKRDPTIADRIAVILAQGSATAADPTAANEGSSANKAKKQT